MGIDLTEFCVWLQERSSTQKTRREIIVAGNIPPENNCSRLAMTLKGLEAHIIIYKFGRFENSIIT